MDLFGGCKYSIISGTIEKVRGTRVFVNPHFSSLYFSRYTVKEFLSHSSGVFIIDPVLLYIFIYIGEDLGKSFICKRIMVTHIPGPHLLCANEY